MIANLSKLSEEERMNYIMYGLDVVSFCVHDDIAAYAKYKAGQVDGMSCAKKSEMEVLSILEQLGYPMDAAGTYLYKEVVVRVKDHLAAVRTRREVLGCVNLILQLKDKYSQFYFDIARNDLDLGVKSFHYLLEEMLERIDEAKVDPVLCKRIYGGFNECMNYGEHAFVLGAYAAGVLQEPKDREDEVSNNVPLKLVLVSKDDIEL